MKQKEKELFIKALIYIATIDDELDEAEKAFFVEAGGKLGLTESDINKIYEEMTFGTEELGQILAGIESAEVKNSLLSTLIDICYIDGKYSEIEKAGMAEICNMLDVDSKVLKKIEMEHWSEEGKQVLRKGMDILKYGAHVAGEKSLQGGKFVATGIVSGLGKVSSKLSDAMASAKKLHNENKELRAELKKSTITDAIKQKIILQLNSKIMELTAELKREKERNNQNEEIIKLLQAQLDDLEKTLEIAEDTEIA